MKILDILTEPIKNNPIKKEKTLKIKDIFKIKKVKQSLKK